MKAFNERFGQVEITERKDSTVTITLQDGTEKRVITKFVKLYDESGNEITDFSSVKESITIPVVSHSGRKTSKLAERHGSWMESKGYYKFNHLTKKYE